MNSFFFQDLSYKNLFEKILSKEMRINCVLWKCVYLYFFLLNVIKIYFWLCWVFTAAHGFLIGVAFTAEHGFLGVELSSCAHMSLVAMQHVESSKTRDGISVPCIGRSDSLPLDHQASPVYIFKMP